MQGFSSGACHGRPHTHTHTHTHTHWESEITTRQQNSGQENSLGVVPRHHSGVLRCAVMGHVALADADLGQQDVSKPYHITNKRRSNPLIQNHPPPKAQTAYQLPTSKNMAITVAVSACAVLYARHHMTCGGSTLSGPGWMSFGPEGENVDLYWIPPSNHTHVVMETRGSQNRRSHDVSEDEKRTAKHSTGHRNKFIRP